MAEHGAMGNPIPSTCLRSPVQLGRAASPHLTAHGNRGLQGQIGGRDLETGGMEQGGQMAWWQLVGPQELLSSRQVVGQVGSIGGRFIHTTHTL